MGELIVIFIVALIVLGPARLPKLAQDLGKAIREFRKAADEVKQEITADDEIRKPFEELHEAVTLSPEELRRREEARRQELDPAAREAEAERLARAQAEAVVARSQSQSQSQSQSPAPAASPRPPASESDKKPS